MLTIKQSFHCKWYGENSLIFILLILEELFRIPKQSNSNIKYFSLYFYSILLVLLLLKFNDLWNFNFGRTICCWVKRRSFFLFLLNKWSGSRTSQKEVTCDSMPGHVTSPLSCHNNKYLTTYALIKKTTT